MRQRLLLASSWRTALLACSVLFAAGSARGEPRSIAVLRQGETAAAVSAQRSLMNELRSVAGVQLIEQEAAAARLARILRVAPAIDAATVRTLERDADEILDAVAFGRDDEAIARGRAVLRRESARLSAVNRLEHGARAVGEICLFVVRALLHAGDRAGAREQVRQCLRAVPDLNAAAAKHPPEVRTLVGAARGEPAGKLLITHVGASDKCAVRVQGRWAGVPPVELEVVPGRYTVQSDCGPAGLVHDVAAGLGETRQVSLAPRLERSLRMGEPTVLSAGALQSSELALLASWLEVPELWLVEPTPAGVLVTRWQTTPLGLAATARARVLRAPAKTRAARLERAARQLLCGREGCADTPGGPLAGPEGVSWGVATAGLGVSAMLGSWVALGRFERRNADLDGLSTSDRGYERRYDARQRMGMVAMVSSSAGAVLFAGSAPFWLPERPRVPWWAWVTGAGGAAAAGIGTTLWVTQNKLEQQPCTDPRGCQVLTSAVPLGPMLVSQGASLLSIPLTYIVRSWTDSSASSVHIDTSRAGLTVGLSRQTALF